MEFFTGTIGERMWKQLRKKRDISTVLMKLSKETSISKSLSYVVDFCREQIEFEHCTIFEYTKSKKIRLIYTTVTDKNMLQGHQMFICKEFTNKFFCKKDVHIENSVYHPVYLVKQLQYIYVFDEMAEENEKYESTCLMLNVLMDYVRNKIVANSSKYLDPYTQIPNELQLRKDIKKCLFQNKNFSLVLVGIDDMTSYNKNYGVEVGDSLVENTISVIRDYFGNDTAIYRYFSKCIAMIVFKDYTFIYDHSMKILDKVKGTGLEINGNTISYSISIGCVELVTLNECSVEDLYYRAERTMKAANGGLCFAGERRELEDLQK